MPAETLENYGRPHGPVKSETKDFSGVAAPALNDIADTRPDSSTRVRVAKVGS